MPTIEIVSILSTELQIRQEDFDISIIEENKLKSHRGLFNEFLMQQTGIILHIGDPDFKIDKEGGFFAGMLIDWSFESKEIFFPMFDENDPDCEDGANQQYKFKLIDKYKTEIDKLLKIAIERSPVKKIYFISDYQYGPAKQEFISVDTIKEFWVEHDSTGLRFNSAYEISGDRKVAHNIA